MQHSLRVLSKNGGALRRRSILPRGIHTSSTAAIAIPTGRNSIGGGPKAEVTSSNDIANSSRAISTGAVSSAGVSLRPNPKARLPNLTPRAKAGFGTSVARKDLGFLPFESNIIFPSMDFAKSSELPEVKVPYLPDNLNPPRPQEPEYKVARPIIETVSDASTHIVAPSAITEVDGLKFSFTFLREEAEAIRDEETQMMRAFKGV